MVQGVRVDDSLRNAAFSLAELDDAGAWIGA